MIDHNSSYDFSTLSDRDLENLVRDLLSRKFCVDFQSFKSGRDGGIDLRYSVAGEENKIVVQVKHYLKSGISQLKSTLKVTELETVLKFNPTRYIVVTSLGLSPQDKEDILDIFNPYILSKTDILRQDDLNNILKEFPDIEEKNFKLWLSSTTVLNRIINNAVRGRSEFSKPEILGNLKKFVPCKIYDSTKI